MKLDLHTDVCVRKNGVLVHRGPNFIVKAGRERLAALVKQDSSLVPLYMAIGDGSAITTDLTATLAGTEHERVLSTLTRDSNLLTWSAAFGAAIASPVTCREVAIFDAAAAGLLLSRIRPADFVITATDVIDITWDLRFGDP